MGKIKDKAIQIAMNQVIETPMHKYCPAVWCYKPDGKFVVAMSNPERPKLFIPCVIHPFSEVPMHGFKTRKTLLVADADLSERAFKNPDYEKVMDGWELIEKREKEKGNMEKNKMEVAAVKKKSNVTLDVTFDGEFSGRINDLYNKYLMVEKEATVMMLEIGLALEYMKEQLPHGQLIKWIEENLTISRMHAHRFRQLARVFIQANSLKPDEAFLLCNPENSKKALGEKLRQMAFDFLGDRTQAELFEQYKITCKEKEKKQYHPPKEVTTALTAEERDTALARAAWTEIGEIIISHQQDWMMLSDAELRTLNDLLWPVAKAINSAVKKQ